MQKKTNASRPVPGLPSRLAALNALLDVFRDGRTIEQAVERLPEWRGLSDADRALAYHLVMTVCRFRLPLEAVLGQFLKNPMKASRLDIHCILLIGLAQQLVLQTPSHANVNVCVAVAKQVYTPLAGLVNAVLRKAAATAPDLWETALADPLNALAPWLAERLQHLDADTRTRIGASFREEPERYVTPKNPATRDTLARELNATVDAESIRLPNEHAPIASLPGYAGGDWWVQDLAATLPVLAAGDVRGMTVLDCCAAPGGKTAQLAAAGAQVTALDISEKRMRRLKENLARLNLTAETVIADALKWKPAQLFDLVLLDAPCSATGTIRRHPELPWLRSTQDIDRLTALQANLLDAATRWVKPGGTIIYAVCSLLQEEGEAQVDAFLARSKFHRQPISLAPTFPAEWRRPSGDVRTLPHSHSATGGVDGFYIAKLHSPT